METRDAILAAARRQFDRGGIEGLSLRDVAGEVGITAMAVYRHYANKQALIDALVLDALDEWSAIVAAIPAGKPIETMLRIGDAHLDFALKRPRRYEAAFLVRSEHARRYPDDFVAGRSPGGAALTALIERAMNDGTLVRSAPIEILLPLAALAQGLITLYFAGRVAGGESKFRTIYRRAMRRFVDSHRAEPRA